MSDLSKIFKGWPPEQDPVVSNLELEAAKTEEFEVSPMVLGLMLSFLLFVIAFWIWLISRSCLVAQPVKPTRERKPRQEAGQSAGMGKSLGRILNKKGQSGTSSSSKQISSSQLTLPQFKSPRLSKSYYMGLDRMENYKLRFVSERTSSDSKTITQSTFNTGTATGSSSLSETSGGFSKESSTGNTTSKTGTGTETGSSSLPESSTRLSKESATGNNNYTTGMSSCLVTNRSRTAGLPMKKYRIRWANMANQKDGQPKTDTTSS